MNVSEIKILPRGEWAELFVDIMSDGPTMLPPQVVGAAQDCVVILIVFAELTNEQIQRIHSSMEAKNKAFGDVGPTLEWRERVKLLMLCAPDDSGRVPARIACRAFMILGMMAGFSDLDMIEMGAMLRGQRTSPEDTN